MFVNLEEGELDDTTHPLYHMLASSPFASPRSDFDPAMLQACQQNMEGPTTFNVKIADLGNACWTVST